MNEDKIPLVSYIFLLVIISLGIGIGILISGSLVFGTLVIVAGFAWAIFISWMFLMGIPGCSGDASRFSREWWNEHFFIMFIMFGACAVPIIFIVSGLTIIIRNLF